MQMAKYYLTNKAVEDLSGIWEYTFETWSEKQADEYYSMLIDFCKKLAGEPEMDKKYDDIKQGLFGYRIHKHIIFYRSVADKEIEVARILHCRMDFKVRINDL